MKKSIFLFFAAILCAMSVSAKTIYLNTGGSSLWNQAEAKFGCWTWGSSDQGDLMSHLEGDIWAYETLDANTDVIFTRVQPTSTGIWDKEWNRIQTKIPADKNCCTITGWGENDYSWSVYTPSTPPVTHTFAKNSTLYIDFRAITDKKGANYPKAGSVGIDYSANAGGTVIPVTFTADVKWTEGAEFMKTEKGGWASIPFKAPEAGQNCAQVAADGKSYTWTTYSEPSVTLSLDKTEADAGTNVTVTLTAIADNVSGEVTYAFQYSTDNVTWNDITATGNTATQTFAAETRYYKVTMTNGGTTKEATAKFSAIKFHVIGSWDDWTVHNEVVEGSKTITLEADTTYEYKITNGTWDYSWGNDGTMTRENCTNWSFEASGNAKITTDEAGDYVFNVSRNAEGKVKVSVTYPVSTPTYTVTVSAENGSVGGLENEGVYEEGASVTLTATAADGYEFVNWTVAGEEVSTENPYTFVVSADVAVVANFVAVDYKDITFTVGKSGFTGVPQIKWWGAKGLEDAAEPVEMTAGQYSRYSYTFSNIDAITGVSFYIVLDGVQSKTITLHETPNTYSQFYTILQEVFVTLDGEIEGVQLEGHPKAGYSSDYTKVNGVVQLPANTTKAFKLTVDGKDKGGNTIALTKDNLTANFTEDGEGNATIATELAGGYLFTYDYITKDVTVVYPFVGTMDLGQMTPSYSDESVTLEDDKYNTVTIYNVVEGEHTYGENFDIEASVKHNGEWYTLTGKGSWTLADGVMTLVATNLVDENNTVNYTINATALAPQEYTIVCNGTYDEEVTEYYSSIKYIGTTNDTTVTIEIASYGGEPNVLGDINGTYFTIAEYVVEEGEDGVKVLTATATDAAGNTYHITITATKLVYPSVNIYGATATLNEEEGALTLSGEYEGQTINCEIWGYIGAGDYEYVGILAADYSFEWGADIATVTEDGDQYTITGVFMDYTTEEKYEVMITTAKNPATALENVTSTVAPVKAIVNGQLVIVKDGVQYNAQGAVVK